MEIREKKTCAKDENNNEVKFSIAFKEDGESFQSIMEKILISKIIKNE